MNWKEKMMNCIMGAWVSWNLMNISLMMTTKPSLCKSQTNHTGSLIVVECPAFLKSPQTNKDLDEFALSDFITANMPKALDIRHDKCVKDTDKKEGKHPDCQSKFLHLQFPSDHLLSSKELESDHKENEVSFEVIDNSAKQSWIVFKVVTLHQEANKAGKTVDSVTQKRSKMAIKKQRKQQGTTENMGK